MCYYLIFWARFEEVWKLVPGFGTELKSPYVYECNETFAFQKRFLYFLCMQPYWSPVGSAADIDEKFQLSEKVKS